MVYSEVVDRITKVIRSCGTSEQIMTAEVYCERLIERYFPERKYKRDQNMILGVLLNSEISRIIGEL
jgi:hypothetical protein